MEVDADWVAHTLEMMQAKHPSVALTASDVSRFLAARKGNQQKALAMLEADCVWRAQRKPESIPQSEVAPVLEHGTWRFIGHNASGFPVVWVQTQHWHPHAYTVELFGRHASYWMEHLTKERERFGMCAPSIPLRPSPDD